MKQLDHERRKKKGEEKMQVDSEQANMSIKQEKDLEIKTDDLVVSYLYDVLLVLKFLLFISLKTVKSAAFVLYIFVLKRILFIKFIFGNCCLSDIKFVFNLCMK